MSREHVETITRSFGVLDAKGREIGGSISIGREIRTPRLAEAKGYSITKECGEWLTASPGALRDGKRFGSSHGWQYFSSQAELDAYVAKYFADAEKRARKAAAKAQTIS
jgi:hypothetical protein